MRKRTIPDHSHYTGKCRLFTLSIYNSSYKMPKKIPVVLQDKSDYDYHFIIKELIEEGDGQLECLREKTKKADNLFDTNKYTKIGDIKAISIKTKFIDSARFRSNSLTSPANDLLEGFHKFKSSYRYSDLARFNMIPS